MVRLPFVIARRDDVATMVEALMRVASLKEASERTLCPSGLRLDEARGIAAEALEDVGVAVPGRYNARAHAALYAGVPLR